jgi:glycosyltransferase involved in cell wall biosynthesis
LNESCSTGKIFTLKISIIVPAFNEERLLGESLAHIKTASDSFKKIGWTTELIVCDNNSTDTTAAIARAAGATVVFEPINQIARARNAGAGAATGDWLIFVDADSHPCAELFMDVAHEIKSGKCIAGGATIRLSEYYFAASWITRLWNFSSRRLRLLAGSFIFCETAVFRQIGGFSHELFVAEELELSSRLKQVARTNGKQVVILHRHPLVTSARKMKLYTAREHLRFIFLAIFNRKTLSSREAAHIWYDGRR